MIRQAAVAGQFYPADAGQLRREVERCIAGESVPSVPAIGIVAPHAGYVYSGAVAGAVYREVALPRVAIILCPNHQGIGAAAAISPDQGWATPLGVVPVEDRLRRLLLEQAPGLLTLDALAHLYEHSLEVHLPFLQTLRPDLTFVPISLGFGDVANCERVGAALAGAVTAFGEPVLLIASSDMTHYEDVATARRKDEMAMEKLLALDPAGLVQSCRSNGITMCGVVPAATMVCAAKLLGATTARLVTYATSGDANGDYRRVVAYASLIIS